MGTESEPSFHSPVRSILAKRSWESGPGSLGNEDRRGRIACVVRNVDGRISAKCQQGCG
jgi:hypothetical protein